MKLLKFLRVFCKIAQIVTVIGAVWISVCIPFALSALASKSAKVGVFFGPNGCEFGLLGRFSNGGRYTANAQHFDGSDAPYGSLTVGPVIVPSVQLTNAPAHTWQTPVETISASSNLVITGREEALSVYRKLALPLVFAYVAGAAILVLILGRLRGLFRAVEKGEAFSPRTLKLVYQIGGLLIGSSVAWWVTTAWLAVEMQLGLSPLLTNGGLTIPAVSTGNNVGLTAGVIILALAEVFRQGVRLTEESKLTI